MLVALVGGWLIRKDINTMVLIYFLGYLIWTSAVTWHKVTWPKASECNWNYTNILRLVHCNFSVDEGYSDQPHGINGACTKYFVLSPLLSPRTKGQRAGLKEFLRFAFEKDSRSLISWITLVCHCGYVSCGRRKGMGGGGWWILRCVSREEIHNSVVA